MSLLSLQVNAAGSWRQVVTFPECEVSAVRGAVVALRTASNCTKWRICTNDSRSEVLWSMRPDGTWAERPFDRLRAVTR